MMINGNPKLSLDALVADLARIDTLTPEQAKVLWLEVCALEKGLAMQAMMGRSANGQDSEDLFTIPEVAARLKVSPDHAYDLCRSGALKSMKLGKKVRVRVSDLAAYLSQQGS
jgi:excisionase family DNA binding protein